jgi:hypothetical protein
MNRQGFPLALMLGTAAGLPLVLAQRGPFGR